MRHPTEKISPSPSFSPICLSLLILMVITGQFWVVEGWTGSSSRPRGGGFASVSSPRPHYYFMDPIVGPTKVSTTASSSSTSSSSSSTSSSLMASTTTPSSASSLETISSFSAPAHRVSPLTEKTTTTTTFSNKSPASSWGRPLDDTTRQRNRQWVRQLKQTLFYTWFGSDTKAVARSYARFYALETIARMPYFAYLSVLHLLETLGRWRQADYLKVHFAESWNEMHHLLMMEELLRRHDAQRWSDQFIAQHVAFGYYWTVVFLYLFNPTLAYHLNQSVEEEAYLSYHQFLTEHAEYLQQQPPPQTALDYYTGSDLYLFDAMHHQDDVVNTSSPSVTDETTTRRRPECRTLYDCFVAIRDDEWEHVKTMCSMQQDEHHPVESLSLPS